MPFRRTYLRTTLHKQNTIYTHWYSKKHAEKRNLDFTEGPIFSKMLSFVLPLMLTNLLQVFYSVADTVIVGFSDEPDAIGAVGITAALTSLIVNVFIGFSTGTNVMVAKYLGEKNDEKVSLTVHTSLLISIIFGFTCTLVGVFTSRPLLHLIGAEGKLLELATTYTVIYFFGIPFISLSNYLIAIYRAKGDTRTPLVILTISGLLNVILNFVFVFAFHTSVEGVALATMISNIVSAIFLTIQLAKDDGPCKFIFKRLSIDTKELKSIISIGLPAGIQGSLFSLSNMTIQSAIIQVNNIMTPVGSLFEPVVKGHTATNSLDSFIYTSQNTVYQAAITFTSQNNGAKKYDRIPKIMKSAYVLGPAIAMMVSVLIIIFKDPLLSLYGVTNGPAGSTESIAYNTALTHIVMVSAPYFMFPLMEVGCGIVRGLGKSFQSTIISLIGICVFRVLWIVTVFNLNPTLETIYWSYPISWILTASVFIVYILKVLRPLLRQKKQEQGLV